MGSHHDELLERLASTMEIGEQREFKFPSVEKAHVEYMNLSRAFKKKGKSECVKALTIRRAKNFITITLDTPPHFWPAATIIKPSGERVQESMSVVQSYGKETEGGETGRIRALMLEDIASGDKDKIEQFLEMFGEFNEYDVKAILLEDSDFDLDTLIPNEKEEDE